MTYNQDKVNIFARFAGKSNNANQDIGVLIKSISGAVGGISKGRKSQAGAIIDKKQLEKFIGLIKKKLEYEVIKTK